MRFTLSFCLMSVLFCALALAPSMAFAQAGVPTSDLLQEFITDHNAPAATPDVPILPGFPPILSIKIPEVAPESEPKVFTLPGREIDFREGASTAPISDRLSISQYQVRVVSDDEFGLPIRPNAIRIPASALEAFLPISISAFSDGNQVTAANLESDHLTITLGYYGPGTGIKDFDETIVEPTVAEPPGGTEPVLTHLIAPIMFDVVEPGAVAGTTQGIISDYVDISEILVKFISSDDQAAYANLPPAHGFVVEDHVLGGGVTYSLGFASDTEVPEPATLTLLGVGVVSVVVLGRARNRRI